MYHNPDLYTPKTLKSLFQGAAQTRKGASSLDPSSPRRGGRKRTYTSFPLQKGYPCPFVKCCPTASRSFAPCHLTSFPLRYSTLSNSISPTISERMVKNSFQLSGYSLSPSITFFRKQRNKERFASSNIQKIG